MSLVFYPLLLPLSLRKKKGKEEREEEGNEQAPQPFHYPLLFNLRMGGSLELADALSYPSRASGKEGNVSEGETNEWRHHQLLCIASFLISSYLGRSWTERKKEGKRMKKGEGKS